MYHSVIVRIHNGESYYDVVGDELRTRGYASRPFFNWRLPTLALIMGNLPSPVWGQWIVMALGLLTLFWWFQVLDRESGFVLALFWSLLFCGQLLLCLNDKGYFYHELWSGMLIAFSLAAYARKWLLLSMMSGMLAVFIRELAVLYLFIMIVAAWKEKRNHELLGWLGGMAAFSLALACHAWVVSGLLTSSDIANESWIQFGGWPFVLSTGNWNAFLLVSPKWIVAVILPLALIGIAGWRGATGGRSALVLCVYCSAFLIAGRVDNTYWGFMYAPLIPLGIIYAVPSLFDLTMNLWGRSQRLLS
ncbi:hypothetical protein [Nitrospira sp. M1]